MSTDATPPPVPAAEPLPDTATVRAQLANLAAENARLRQQRNEARDWNNDARRQLAGQSAEVAVLRGENVRLGGELGAAEDWAIRVCAEHGLHPDEDTLEHRLDAVWNWMRSADLATLAGASTGIWSLSEHVDSRLRALLSPTPDTPESGNA